MQQIDGKHISLKLDKRTEADLAALIVYYQRDRSKVVRSLIRHAARQLATKQAGAILQEAPRD